jgi:hypothetical protein
LDQHSDLVLIAAVQVRRDLLQVVLEFLGRHHWTYSVVLWRHSSIRTLSKLLLAQQTSQTLHQVPQARHGVHTLARRLQRFINKHAVATNTMLQLAVEQGTPTTTNALESKNSIFKPFSLIAKFFPIPERCQSLFAGVALMENFDVKTRGPHRGASAMQRAEINLDDFDATDFFSTVGLLKPQISLAAVIG